MKRINTIASEWISIGNDDTRKKEYLKSLTDEEFALMCTLPTVAQVKMHWAKVRSEEPEIVAFESVGERNFFLMGKTAEGISLKNRFTEIPNEFEMYDLTKIEEAFNDACKMVKDLEEVSQMETGDLAVKVHYSDGTSRLLREGKDNNQFTHIVFTASSSNEFLPPLCFYYNDYFSLFNLRKLCRKGRADFRKLYGELKYLYDDDFEYVHINECDDGTICINHSVFCVDRLLMKIMPDGQISETDEDMPFLTLLKQQGVRVSFGKL